MPTHSRTWIRDYPELLICFEFTIIANLEDWKFDMVIFVWKENPRVWPLDSNLGMFIMNPSPLTTQPPHR